MLSQILTSCRSSSRKNYKNWQGFLIVKKYCHKIKIYRHLVLVVALVPLVMEMRRNIQYMCQKNVEKKKHFDLLLIGEEGKKQYVLIKDFNIFMHDHTLQIFSTEEILKRHIWDCFKINGKQRIIRPKKLD